MAVHPDGDAGVDREEDRQGQRAVALPGHGARQGAEDRDLLRGAEAERAQEGAPFVDARDLELDRQAQAAPQPHARRAAREQDAVADLGAGHVELAEVQAAFVGAGRHVVDLRPDIAPPGAVGEERRDQDELDVEPVPEDQGHGEREERR